ncbi:MAG: L-seryl-tRNA(Sec) selenium transferase, partial [Anaerolineales bacterium]|nr:L-seryl-tRNA(Sec) selenium transferase [Anaerolineales bacterium]
EATREVPVWRMISMEPRAVKVRAVAWRERLGQGEVAASESTVGGGSLPDESMPTFVLSLSVKNPDKFLKRLRESNPPIIARTEADKILLDPRTVLVEQDISLLSALYSLLSEFK